jgi:CheY-like chemotaxis protein
VAFPAAAAHRCLRVLVAEDYAPSRRLLSVFLRKAGHAVDEASDGDEAVERARASRYDLILMDVQMPSVDGCQAASAIRALPDEERARVPILALTAYALPEAQGRCLRAGMDGVLSKPVDAWTLLEAVGRYAAGGGPAREGGWMRTTRERATAARSPSEPEISEDESSGRGESPPEGFPAGLEAGRELGGPASPSDSRSRFEGANSNASNEAPWNPADALARLGGKKEILWETLRGFTEDAPFMVVRLRSAIEAGRAEELHREAHGLRGLASYLSAPGVVRAATSLDRAARARDLGSAPRLLESLQREIERLLPALEQFQSDGP